MTGYAAAAITAVRLLWSQKPVFKVVPGPLTATLPSALDTDIALRNASAAPLTIYGAAEPVVLFPDERVTFFLDFSWIKETPPTAS